MPKHRVVIEKDLQEIVPNYLQTRVSELPQLLAAHAAGDLETLRKSGHKLAGSGGGYGFDRLSEIGKTLETKALAGDAAACAVALADLKDYVENLEVVYE